MARLRSLPLRVLLPLLFGLSALLWLGMGFLVMPRDQPLFLRLIGTVVYAGAMTAFFGVVISRARRRAGGADELSRMQAAAKAGVIPRDVYPATWIPTFEQWQHQYRTTRWLSPVMFTALIALSLWLAATSGPIWLVFAAFFLAALVWTTIDAWRGYGKITRMLQELQGGESNAR